MNQTMAWGIGLVLCLKAATITGCLLRGDGAISDSSGSDVQMGFNTTH
jgi:hypothetical protein